MNWPSGLIQSISHDVRELFVCPRLETPLPDGFLVQERIANIGIPEDIFVVSIIFLCFDFLGGFWGLCEPVYCA